jgi:hypothetical protein
VWWAGRPFGPEASTSPTSTDVSTNDDGFTVERRSMALEAGVFLVQLHDSGLDLKGPRDRWPWTP